MKTVFQHELRRGRKGLLIWAGAISFLLAVQRFTEMVFPKSNTT